LERGENFVVEDFEATSTDRSEESTEEEVVGIRFGGLLSEFERVHDQIREVREEDRFVLFGEDGDSHERHLVKSEHY